MPQPYCKRSLTLHVLPFFLLLSITPTVFAADQDTSLRLNQTIEYRANEQEREFPAMRFEHGKHGRGSLGE